MEAYQAQFQQAGDARAIGEASPLYLYHESVPHRLRQYLPDVKLIAILRNPIERAYSAFMHLIRDHREPVSDFREALALEDARILSSWEHIWHYARMGFYYEQLSRYYESFPKNQLRIYLYDRFFDDALQRMQDIFDFLGVDRCFVPDMSIKYNAAPNALQASLPLAAEVKPHLRRLFREDVSRLQDLLRLDLSHWLE
jgi:hypothetical protein